MATPVPANIPLLSLLGRVTKGSQAAGVQRLSPLQIDDVESVFGVGSHI